MVTDSSWIGGWVRKDEVTMYITTRGNVEQDVGGRTLGSERNPFTDQAYYEMDTREEWVGGYVLFAGESNPSYVRPSGENEVDGSGCGSGCGSGSGSGCGSGCGCGCGCGSGTGRLTPGSEILSVGGRYAGMDGHYKVEVSWDVESQVTAKVIGFYKSKTGVEECSGSLTVTPKGAYTYEISGLGLSFEYVIPEFYRVD